MHLHVDFAQLHNPDGQHQLDTILTMYPSKACKVTAGIWVHSYVKVKAEPDLTDVLAALADLAE